MFESSWAVLLAIGAAPLVVFLAFDVSLRMVRRWESGRLAEPGAAQ